ncbi:MAG TPA: redoxin domain-containing protein [bacterium]|nr:redoxin domain-containing protein [bacterium]
MKRLLLLAAALLPTVLPAQGGRSAQAAVEELTAELNRQKAVYRAARKVVTDSEAYREARKARDNRRIRELLAGVERPDNQGLARKAMELAQQYEGDDRVRLLGWAAVNCGGDKGIVGEVVDVLERDHIDSPALDVLLEKAMVLARPLGQQRARTFLEKVVDESPHKLPKAWALYWQSVLLRRGRGRGAGGGDPAAAAKLLAEAEKLAQGHWLADKIAGPRFKKEHLQIGMEAPNIVGEDLDGVPFELKDYRGKVVVLDFWGFW